MLPSRCCGPSCASYWWTRIAACGLRLTLPAGPDFPLDMLLTTLTTWNLWGVECRGGRLNR